MDPIGMAEEFKDLQVEIFTPKKVIIIKTSVTWNT